MKGLIVVNAYIKNQSQVEQAERIAEELRTLGVTAEIEKNFNLAKINGGAIVAGQYDFCVFLDKDRVAARLLEGAGLKLFNSSHAIEVCDDKMLTNVALAGKGFNIPDCIYAPLCYYEGSALDIDFLEEVAKELTFPLVAKQNYGSLGAGVELIKDFPSLAEYERAHITLPHFYQKFIAESAGEDVRVMVIGGRFVSAMKRTNKADFRSNIGLGGSGERYEADEQLKRLCERVAAVLGLDYCGVDVLTDKSGKRYICEVNSNAFFSSSERVCGVNIAKAYSEHILSYLREKCV